MGTYVPTATTWMYGVYHLVTAHLPLTLLIAGMINIRTGSGALINANTPATHYTRATVVTTNGLMFLIVLKQAWLGKAQSYYKGIARENFSVTLLLCDVT